MNASTPYTPPIEHIIHMVVPVLFLAIVVFGLVGNLLVILVYFLNRVFFEDSTNMLIVSLASADLLFVVLCVPFTAFLYATSQWPFGSRWCRFVTYFQHVSAFVSVWTLVLMALDRFMAVVFPVRAMVYRTRKNTLIICVFLWAAIIVANSPLLWLMGVYEYRFYGQNRSLCVYVNQVRRTATQSEIRWYYWSFSFWAYFLPLGVICVLYGFLVHKLRKGPFGVKNLKRMVRQNKRVRSPEMIGNFRDVSEESLRNKKRVTQMVAVVIGTFAFCWLFQNLRFVYIGATYPNENNSNRIVVVFQIFAQVLAYTNSCCNPILFAFTSENYRKGFENIFRIFLRKRPLQISRKLTTAYPNRTGPMSPANSETRLLHRTVIRKYTDTPPSTPSFTSKSQPKDYETVRYYEKLKLIRRTSGTNFQFGNRSTQI